MQVSELSVRVTSPSLVHRWRAAATWYHGWNIVGVAFLNVSGGLGTRAAFGVLLVALVETMGWSRGLVAGAISLNALL